MLHARGFEDLDVTQQSTLGFQLNISQTNNAYFQKAVKLNGRSSHEAVSCHVPKLLFSPLIKTAVLMLDKHNSV